MYFQSVLILRHPGFSFLIFFTKHKLTLESVYNIYRYTMLDEGTECKQIKHTDFIYINGIKLFDWIKADIFMTEKL